MANFLRILAAFPKNMRFDSQDIKGSLNLSVTPVPWMQCSHLVSIDTRQICSSQKNMQTNTHMCNTLKIKLNKKCMLVGWYGVLVVKCTRCSSRGLELGSQHPCHVANHYLQLQFHRNLIHSFCVFDWYLSAILPLGRCQSEWNSLPPGTIVTFRPGCC